MDPQSPNMSPEQFRKSAHEAVDWIADYLENVRDYPVLPSVEPGDLVDALPPAAPEQGEPMDRILEDFRKLVVPGITHWNHPRFFGYFSVSASGPGIIGEMLTAALNVNAMLWKSSPAATELEQVTLGWLRDWVGLPPTFFGMIHDTASTAVMHAIIAAREQACPEARTEGRKPDLVLYASEHAHSSVEKGALAVGIGQSNVRLIPSDGSFCLRADALESAIQADIAAGRKPFCVVATAGTTSATSIDPLEAVADIAETYGLWYHIDGAYGGTAAIVPELRPLFPALERADSLLLNPHKWMFTPIDLCAFYTRRPDILHRAFSMKKAAYLETPGHERALNYSDYGVPLGRRFRSLKLWFVMRHYGREGVIEIIRKHVQWARELASWIEADPRFEVTAPVPLSLVCFRLRGEDERNRALMEAVNATGKVFVSGTVLGGQFVIRLVLGHSATTKADVELAWETIRGCAETA
ncbi:MAG: pyridoxal-dependent decarboxylase [Bryobacteraceae bacterium]